MFLDCVEKAASVTRWVEKYLDNRGVKHTLGSHDSHPLFVDLNTHGNALLRAKTTQINDSSFLSSNLGRFLLLFICLYISKGVFCPFYSKAQAYPIFVNVTLNWHKEIMLSLGSQINNSMFGQERVVWKCDKTTLKGQKHRMMPEDFALFVCLFVWAAKFLDQQT